MVEHCATAASEWPSTPIKPSGYQYGELCLGDGKSHEDDDAAVSTAAPSVLPSPAGGWPRSPPKVPVSSFDLGLALESLGEDEGGVTAEQALLLQLQRRLEWYFSAEYLCADGYLRSQMDRFGWVHLSSIVQFSGFRSLNATSADVISAIGQSSRLQLAGDFRRLRARNPAVWAAFAPRPTEEDYGSTKSTCPPSSASPCGGADAFEPAMSIADEDMTIAACLDAATPTTIRSTRRLRGRRARAATKGDFKFLGWDHDAGESLAWVRLEDGAYTSPASAILQW